jgi:hypothetical protein
MRVTVTLRRRATLPSVRGRSASLASLLRAYEPQLVIEDESDRRVSVEATEAQVRALRDTFADTLAFSPELRVEPF